MGRVQTFSAVIAQPLFDANAPYERADLEKKMAGHMAAFDRLREVPKVAASRLIRWRVTPTIIIVE
tara:strand:+ start:5523 stop:5720 length:198 start_codon:yes stop_codon:yes gene_type:complete